MKGLNKVYLIGYIGQSPELRRSANGTSVLKLSVATPNVRKINDEWVDTPDWHRLTAFGHDADYLSRFGRKGSSVALECYLKQSRWTDREGRVHNDVEIVIDRVLWLGTRNHKPAEAGAEQAGEGAEQAGAEAGDIGPAYASPDTGPTADPGPALDPIRDDGGAEAMPF